MFLVYRLLQLTPRPCVTKQVVDARAHRHNHHRPPPPSKFAGKRSDSQRADRASQDLGFVTSPDKRGRGNGWTALLSTGEFVLSVAARTFDSLSTVTRQVRLLGPVHGHFLLFWHMSTSLAFARTIINLSINKESGGSNFATH